MRIRTDALPLRFETHRRAGVLSPGDEELLFGREAVGVRHRMSDHRLLKRTIGNAHASEISDRLAQHALSIVVNAGLDEVTVELIDYALGTRLELLAIRLGPPILRPTDDVDL